MSKGVIIFLSILLIILLIVAVSLIANFHFNRKIKEEVNDFFSKIEFREEMIEETDLAGLPPSVQKWLQYSQVIGNERINAVRLKQNSEMKLKEDQAWMPVQVEQYFTVDEPGFIWKAKIKAAPLVHIVGRDKYEEGRGNMRIKVMSLIKVADATGAEMDQGTLLRYLAEIVWFPTAALSNYITWEEIDQKSALATMSYGGVTASGVFNFNQKGEVVSFTAERYGEFDGEYRIETWLVSMEGYKEFQGIMIPTKGQVTWKLEDGDFNWFKFDITDIEYNKPIAF
ncbi:MAG: DUF6544 family protein [Bacillota bacterium]|nr:DUF6544 family protein [Bacillota bacterium]